MPPKMEKNSWVQGPGSNRPELKHPESSHPIIQNPNVETMRPVSSFSSMPSTINRGKTLEAYCGSELILELLYRRNVRLIDVMVTILLDFRFLIILEPCLN